MGGESESERTPYFPLWPPSRFFFLPELFSRALLSERLEQAKHWQMEFNPEKCFIMCISKQTGIMPPFRECTFCNTSLAYVEKHPYLGVTLDANLRWNHHLHELSSKATKTLNLIKRNFWFCNEDTKCFLYKTLVRLKLECASLGPALSM